MANFMKLAVARRREYLGLPPLSSGEFLKLMREKGKVVELDSKLTGRAVNEGFSGGEKKKNEIFQMAMLSRNSPYWTRRTAGSTSTRSASWRRG